MLKNNLLGFLLAEWMLCAAVLGQEEIVVKFDRYKNPQLLDCSQQNETIKAFLTDTSRLVHDATKHKSIFRKVIVEFPFDWNGCEDLPRRHLPLAATDLLFGQDEMTTMSLQHESCGRKGRQVLVKYAGDGISDDPKQLATEYLKYRFGLFDESGQGSNSGMFPQFYRRREEKSVMATSCTNVPVKPLNTSGEMFPQVCLDDPKDPGCALREDQADVLTSLLYSSDQKLYPKMSQLCNAATHNKVAPTPQNLLCDARSAMEVIQAELGDDDDDQLEYREPVFEFVRAKPTAGAVLIVLDQSPAMNQNRWRVLRAGLEYLLLSLMDDTEIRVESQKANSNNQWQTLKDMRRNLGVYFPEHFVSGLPYLDLGDIYERIKDELNNIPYAQVLIITATDALPNEDLTAFVEKVNTDRLQVDVVTLDNTGHPGLLKLASFGEVYAVPEYPFGQLQMSQVHHAGLAFQQIASSVMGVKKQQLVEIQEPQGRDGEIRMEGHFEISSGMTSLGDQAQMEVMVASPYSQELSINGISLRDPEGMWYNGTGDISKTLDQVYSLPHVKYVEGKWSYSINGHGLTNPPFSGAVYLTVSLEVGNMAFGSAFLGGPALSRIINTSTTNAVAIYGLIESVEIEQQTRQEVTVHFHRSGTNQTTKMVDNGLVAPDVNESDGIYSQYFLDFFQSRYYSTRFSVESGHSWVGPSFYVSVPRDPQGPDSVPPARIMDLRAAASQEKEGLISLTFTAPGDDLTVGCANHYIIKCGFGEDHLEYYGCEAPLERSQSLAVAHTAGSQEEINLILSPNFIGVQIYIAITAQDGNGNRGQQSNIVGVFAPGTNIPISTPSPNSDDKGTEKEGIYLSMPVFMTLLVVLGILLLAIVLLLIIGFWLRKQGGQRHKNQGNTQQTHLPHTTNPSAPKPEPSLQHQMTRENYAAAIGSSLRLKTTSPSQAIGNSRFQGTPRDRRPVDMENFDGHPRSSVPVHQNSEQTVQVECHNAQASPSLTTVPGGHNNPFSLHSHDNEGYLTPDDDGDDSATSQDVYSSGHHSQGKVESLPANFKSMTVHSQRVDRPVPVKHVPANHHTMREKRSTARPEPQFISRRSSNPGLAPNGSSAFTKTPSHPGLKPIRMFPPNKPDPNQRQILSSHELAERVRDPRQPAMRNDKWARLNDFDDEDLDSASTSSANTFQPIDSYELDNYSRQRHQQHFRQPLHPNSHTPKARTQTPNSQRPDYEKKFRESSLKQKVVRELSEQPFDYAKFSQFLYGEEKSTTREKKEATPSSLASSRNVSYV